MSAVHLPIDLYLGTQDMSIHDRINARPSIYFQPGDKKHCTKNDMGDIATDLRRKYDTIDISKLGADGYAMTFDNY